MKENLIYVVENRLGKKTQVKIVPDVLPGVNGRKAFRGIFHLFHVFSKNSLSETEIDMDTYISFAGSISFLNENFFEWTYDGRALTEMEIAQVVRYIQDNNEKWASWLEELPPLSDQPTNDMEEFENSEALLQQIKDHPLFSISPHFVYGTEDDLIAIVKDGAAYDIYINGEIVAVLKMLPDKQCEIINGAISNTGLLKEVIRRIAAIDEL